MNEPRASQVSDCLPRLFYSLSSTDIHTAAPRFSLPPTCKREAGLMRGVQVLGAVRREVSDACTGFKNECACRFLRGRGQPMASCLSKKCYKTQAKTEFKKIEDEVKKAEDEEARLVKIRKE